MNNNGSKSNGSKSSPDPNGNNLPGKNSKKPYSNDPNASSNKDSSYSQSPLKDESIGSGYSEGKKDYSTEPESSYNQGRYDEQPSQKEKYKKKYNEFEDKMKDTFKNIQGSDFYHYASSNKEQTITYILLALGLIFLLFIHPLFGGLLIGMVAGYHFAPQIIYYLRHITQIFEGQDQLRYIVLTGTLLGLLIAAPGIFIGALIVAVFKQLIYAKKDPTQEEYYRNSSKSNEAGISPKSDSRTENKFKRP